MLSLRAFSKQTFSFSIHFSLHIHQFHVSSSFCVFCLARCSLDFLAFLVWLQAFFQASAQMPTRGIYSDVTLPCIEDIPNYDILDNFFEDTWTGPIQLGLLNHCPNIQPAGSIQMGSGNNYHPNGISSWIYTIGVR